MCNKEFWCFVYIVIQLCQSGANGDTLLHIDASYGHDHPSCGTEETPCRSIHYGFELRYKEYSNGTFHCLLHGHTESDVFSINKTIQIKPPQSVSMARLYMKCIKRRPEAKCIIKPNATNVERIFDLKRHMFAITVVGVDVIGLNIMSPVTVSFFVLINVTVTDLRASLINETFLAMRLSIYIESCTFQHVDNIIHNSGNSHLMVDISSSVFKGRSTLETGIDIAHAASQQYNVFNLRIVNTLFTGLNSAINIQVDAFNRNTTIIKVVIENSTFVNNTLQNRFTNGHIGYAPLNLIGITNVNISNTTFENNAGILGGALHLRNLERVKIENCVFFNNHAAASGGGCYIFNISAPALVQNCYFEKNSIDDPYNIAESQGGAITCLSNLNIENCEFVNNSAQLFGGSIFHRETGSIIFNGGGTKSGNETLKITNSSFHAYDSSLFGGVIYSTSTMILNNTKFKIFRAFGTSPLIYHSNDNAVNITNGYHFECPTNHRVFSKKRSLHNKTTSYKLMLYYCIPCEKGTYSLHSGQEDMENDTLVTKQPKCHFCPTGGKCGVDIVSNDNFWGYNTSDEIVFTACPSGYCCSAYNKLCTSYNTCSYNRSGILCGKCEQGFSENLAAVGCINNRHCPDHWFWAIFVMATLLYVVLIMYFKDIIAAAKRAFKIIPSKSSTLKRRILTSLDSEYSINSRASQPTFTSYVSVVDDDDFCYYNPDDVDEDDYGTDDNNGYNADDDDDDEDAGRDHNRNRNNEDITEERRSLPSENECREEGYVTVDKIESIKEKVEVGIHVKRHQTVQTKVAGIFKVLFFFYQVYNLLRVPKPSKYGLHWKEFVTSFFNIKLNLGENDFKMCPVKDLTPVGRESVKVSFAVSTFVIIAALYCGWYVYCKCNGSAPTQCSEILNDESVNDIKDINETVPCLSKIPINLRLKCCLIQMMLLCYAPIASYSFEMLHCVTLWEDSQHLYVDGNVQCYQWWQYLIGVFVGLWIIPFSLALYSGCYLARSCKVTLNEFLLLIIFPPSCIYFRFRAWKYASKIAQSKEDLIYLRHALLVLDEPFRRRKTDIGFVTWEAMLIFRRLVLVIIRTFSINPITRLYLMLFPLLLFLVDHIRVKPYKSRFLNWTETISLVLLCFLSAVNLFWAYSYFTDISFTQTMLVLSDAFFYLEAIILLAPVYLIFLLLTYLLARKYLKFNRCRNLIVKTNPQLE